MPGHDVYLVGSVPMANSEQVLEAVSAALGTRIKRIPDGETGERGDWITWLEPVFAASPALEKSGEFFRVHATGTGRERYKLKAGRKPRGRAFREPALRRLRAGILRGVQAAQGRGQDRPSNQVPDRPGAGAFGDLALSGRRAARADRPDLQRGGEARDRQDRGGAAARRNRDPVRRGVGGVRAAGAQSRRAATAAPSKRRRKPSATS